MAHRDDSTGQWWFRSEKSTAKKEISTWEKREWGEGGELVKFDKAAKKAAASYNSERLEKMARAKARRQRPVGDIVPFAEERPN